ncbi:MAG TPA: maleylpyruvate isomerase N-terminal domain-containing protein, partial [Chloroflexota bacterium]
GACRRGQDALLSAFDQAAVQLSQRLLHEPAGRAVQVTGGLTLSLDEYLRTRMAELAVHADDLAVSIGAEASLPRETWGEAIQMLVDLARLRHGDVAVLRALARRERVTDAVFPVL